MPYHVLVVDDEEELASSLSEILVSNGYESSFLTTPLGVPAFVKTGRPDLIIMDIKMPKLGGIDLLKCVKKENRSIPVIMITGYPSIENAVQAMKYGALNFFVKPLDIRSLLDEVRLVLDTKRRGAADDAALEHREIVTKNHEMQTAIEHLKKVAPTDAPIIISGESGTGKELAASMLHRWSRRSEGPFVTVNCAAIPDNLLESELFGHEKGAFTDATSRHIGKFELADGGSVFLDEIGDMSLRTQAKILRVLQEKKFERLGGREVLSADTRVVAATNKDVRRLIREGDFREDLYYRLSVVTLELPPLRRRREDVMLLAEHFLGFFNRVYGKNIRDFSEEVKAVFLAHTWPGNVRELKNCVERAVIFCDRNTIGVSDLSSQYRDAGDDFDIDGFRGLFSSLSRELISDALKRAGGSKQKAADLLKINRRTLYNKMKKLGMQ